MYTDKLDQGYPNVSSEITVVGTLRQTLWGLYTYTVLFYLEFLLRSIEFLIFYKIIYKIYEFYTFERQKSVSLKHNCLVSVLQSQVNGTCNVGFFPFHHGLQVL